MTLSEQLRKLIAECPVSRHRLCILTGINAGNLAQFMAGKRGLSQESLDALGMVLGLKLAMNQRLARKLAAAAPPAGRPAVKRARRSK